MAGLAAEMAVSPNRTVRRLLAALQSWVRQAMAAALAAMVGAVLATTATAHLVVVLAVVVVHGAMTAHHPQETVVALVLAAGVSYLVLAARAQVIAELVVQVAAQGPLAELVAVVVVAVAGVLRVALVLTAQLAALAALLSPRTAAP